MGVRFRTASAITRQTKRPAQPALRRAAPDAPMILATIRQFLDLLTRGLLAPRSTVRTIIDGRPDLAARLTLLALAAALQGALWALTALLAGSGGLGFGGQFRLAVQVFVNYVVTATIAYHVGRHFGGEGSRQDVATAVAWHAMLTAALTPALALAVVGATPNGTLSAGTALLVIGYAVYNVWLLGCCVAEAHGFRSAARVAAVAFGLSAVVAFILLMLAGGLAGLG